MVVCARSRWLAGRVTVLVHSSGATIIADVRERRERRRGRRVESSCMALLVGWLRVRKMV